MIRRSSGQASPLLRSGEVVLDPRSARVTMSGTVVRLTTLEFRVLSYLMHHSGRVVSQSELVEHIYAARCRPRLQHRGSVHRAVEEKARRGHDRHGAWPWIPNGGRVKLRSLHARFIAGAVFWTVGLLAAAVRDCHHGRHAYYRKVGVARPRRAAGDGRRGARHGRPVRDSSRTVADCDAPRSPRRRARRAKQPARRSSIRTKWRRSSSDLNGLLDDRERRVARAAAKAGDLAHGLKTPLGILAQEIARAEAAGQQRSGGVDPSAGRAHAPADRLASRAGASDRGVACRRRLERTPPMRSTDSCGRWNGFMQTARS